MRNGECGSLKHGMHVSMGSEPHEPVEERFIGNMSVGLRVLFAKIGVQVRLKWITERWPALFHPDVFVGIA
jgi:hypothetical protein